MYRLSVGKEVCLMLIQYLFKDTQHRTALETYTYEYDVKAISGDQKGQVTRTITAEKVIRDLNENCWVVQFKINERKPEDCARHLSAIHEEIVSNYAPFTLDNGASSYFNQRLYPLINIFEMRLRKFLFLSIALAENKGLWRKIKDLDRIDFYTLYLRLFTSTTFNTELYKLFDETKPKYTKAHIQQLIANIDEKDVLWDIVVGDKLQTIKSEFLSIKAFRNDVMHAHYISHSAFLKASKLFKTINDELSVENDRLVQFPEDVTSDEAISNVINSILAEYGDTPISVVETWLSTSGADIKEYLKKLLED
jgi:hypothetical protein